MLEENVSWQTLEPTIIDVCAKHKKEHHDDEDYRACVSMGTAYLVKFGGGRRRLYPELRTQTYVAEYAKSQSDAPRIADVLYYFEHGYNAYLVMEFIKLDPAPQDLDARSNQAVEWLSRVPSPAGHTIGPLGGGYIRHLFFKDYEAPLLFSSPDALKRYLDEAFRRLHIHAQRKLRPVDISGDRWMFVQPDMDRSNFGVDENGRTVLMDFGQIGLMPETFMAATLYSEPRLFPAAESLGLSRNSNYTMSAMSARLWMTADPRFGLNNEGLPEALPQHRQKGVR